MRDENMDAVLREIYKPCKGLTDIDQVRRFCFGGGYLIDPERNICDECIKARYEVDDTLWIIPTPKTEYEQQLTHEFWARNPEKVPLESRKYILL